MQVTTHGFELVVVAPHDEEWTEKCGTRRGR
jgi:hypothetical protein